MPSKKTSGAQKKKNVWTCYCVRSLAGKRFVNRTYVGKTNDPFRRLRQHNGEISGGARYTKSYRPWVHWIKLTGFKTERHVLQFEWAWKHRRKGTGGGLKGRAKTLEYLLSLPRVTKRAPLLKDETLLVVYVKCKRSLYCKLAGISEKTFLENRKKDGLRFIFSAS